MRPERKAVDVGMDRLRCRISAFAAAWDAMEPAPKRVLVLRGDGLSLQEVALHLGMTTQTANQDAKRVMETMRSID